MVPATRVFPAWILVPQEAGHTVGRGVLGRQTLGGRGQIFRPASTHTQLFLRCVLFFTCFAIFADCMRRGGRGGTRIEGSARYQGGQCGICQWNGGFGILRGQSGNRFDGYRCPKIGGRSPVGICPSTRISARRNMVSADEADDITYLSSHCSSSVQGHSSPGSFLPPSSSPSS